MTSLEIPVQSRFPFDSFRVTLDGEAYRLEWKWNDRAESWSLDVLDVNGEPILMGVRVVADWNLFEGRTDRRLPPGALVVRDTSGKGEPPARDELGERAKVFYVPAAD